MSGKTSLFPGLAIFFGLWAAVGIGFILLEGIKDGPWFLLIPFPVMHYSYSSFTKVKPSLKWIVDSEELTIKHTLFGLGIPFRTKTSNVARFSTKCLGTMPSDTHSQATYLLGVKRHTDGFKVLTPALLAQWDSRALNKCSSEYGALTTNK